MSIVLSIIIALVVLSILVVVHEGGHYFMGKWLGFKILEFSVGMGPKLLSKEKNGTVYSLRAFPIGGMCAFEGEDKDSKEEGAFNSFPAWKRLLVALAGPFMNIVLAFVLAALLMLIFGEYKPITLAKPMITNFTENAPAQAAGLQAGDIVVSVNGTDVATTDEMIEAIRSDADGNIALRVLRPTESSKVLINGVEIPSDTTDFTEFCDEHPAISYTAEVIDAAELAFNVTDTYNEKEGRNMIGATVTNSIGTYEKKYNPITAVPAGAQFVSQTMDQMINFFGSLFKGGVSAKDVSGIVGVVDVVNDGVSSVIEQEDTSAGEKTTTLAEFALYLAVILSVNLGIINLLPLPALDGGRILFNLIEIVARRPIPMKVEGIIHTVGLILLLALIAVITVKDVVFLFLK